MPRQTLKKRADGRYRCKYKDMYFYGYSPSEALAEREAYKRKEAAGLRMAADGITVRDYAVKWLPIHRGHLDARQYNAFAIYIDRFCEHYGNLRMLDITASDIKRFYGLYADMSQSTISKMRQTISGMFRSATADRIILYDPCLDVKAPSGTSDTHRAITDHERELIHKTKSKMRAAAMCMLYAGLRRGEVLALDVSQDVDFVSKTIHITRAVSFDTHGRPVVGDPKTEAGERWIPLLEILEEELKDIKGLVVSKKDGTIMSDSSFTKSWDAYMNALSAQANSCSQKRWYGKRKCDQGKQLAPWEEISIRPHDLRHSFCTMLHDNDVDIKTAMKWMGHADEKMTRQIYTHLTEQREARSYSSLANGINNTLRGQFGGQAKNLIFESVEK